MLSPDKKDKMLSRQSEKPSGSCVTDSIYLDWKPPAVDGGRFNFYFSYARPILGHLVNIISPVENHFSHARLLSLEMLSLFQANPGLLSGDVRLTNRQLGHCHSDR